MAETKLTKTAGEGGIVLTGLVDQMREQLAEYNKIDQVIADALEELGDSFTVASPDDRTALNGKIRRAGGTVSSIDKTRLKMMGPIKEFDASVLANMRERVQPLQDRIATAKEVVKMWDQAQAEAAANQAQQELEKRRKEQADAQAKQRAFDMALEQYRSKSQGYIKQLFEAKSVPEIKGIQLPGLGDTDDLELLKEREVWVAHMRNSASLLLLAFDDKERLKVVKEKILQTVGMTAEANRMSQARKAQEAREATAAARRQQMQEAQERREQIRVGLQGPLKDENIQVMDLSQLPADCYEIKLKKTAIKARIKDKGFVPGLSVTLNNGVTV